MLEVFKQHQRVDPHIAFRMELGRLRHALHRGHFRQQVLDQPGDIQQFEPVARTAFGQDSG